MNCKVENGRLTIEKDGRTFSFEAHGEAPRPSLMGMGISAGGKAHKYSGRCLRSFALSSTKLCSKILTHFLCRQVLNALIHK